MQTLAYSNITVLIEVIHLYHTFMNLMGGGSVCFPQCVQNLEFYGKKL